MKKPKNKAYFSSMMTPAGSLDILSTPNGVRYISFASEKLKPILLDYDVQEDQHYNTEIIQQLNEYFAGNRRVFDIKLDLQGTEFQKTVWKTLMSIPYGKTRSYGWVAEKIGSPRASRAVGLANSKNPIPIIIPCHRIIGSNGKLVGYAAGLKIKKLLLELEQKEIERTNPSKISFYINQKKAKHPDK